MNESPRLPTIEVVPLGESPWFALSSTDPEVSAEVIATATYHVATVRAACADRPWARSSDWLHGVACGYLQAAIAARDIVWNGTQWRLGAPSLWAWLQKVWKRLWG